MERPTGQAQKQRTVYELGKTPGVHPKGHKGEKHTKVKSDLALHTYNPRTLEVDEGSGVQGQCWLQGKSEASLAI